MISRETFLLGLKICMGILLILIVWINLEKYDLLSSDTFSKQEVIVIDKDIRMRTKDAVEFRVPITLTLVGEEKNPRNSMVAYQIESQYQTELNSYSRNYPSITNMEELSVFAANVRMQVDSITRILRKDTTTLVIMDVTANELIVEPRFYNRLVDLEEKRTIMLKAEAEARALELKAKSL